jgi:hypothetical protein
MTYPTISVSVNSDRLKKISDLLRVFRRDDDTVSRSEVVCIAIDRLHASVCPSEGTDVPPTEQVAA